MKLPGWQKRASRREQWRPVLEAEVKRWSAMSWVEILAEAPGADCYQVEFKGKTIQVEVQVLENTKDYIHIAVAVDDGCIPASFHPLSESFIVRKGSPGTKE